jgi:hypothetical protein
MEYPVQSSSRCCAATGRELAEGETYYSLLVESEGRLVRHDYSESAWPGPSEDALAFWKGTVAQGQKRRRTLRDPELLLNLFERLQQQGEPGTAGFRYFLALLLLRKRFLKFVDSERSDDDEVWLLSCPRTESTHRVVNPHLSDEQLVEVEEELGRLLDMDV